MSFSYNPYQHIEIIIDIEGRLSLLCSSCGGQIGLRTEYISDAFDAMADHLRQSHGRTPADFAGWSVE